MEKVLTESEKIKRAQEIYYRRNMQNISGVRVASKTVNSSEKKERKTVKKMFLQICICVLLYIILLIIQNSNYIFSESVIAKVNEILNYDISFQDKISQVVDWGKTQYAIFFENSEVPVSANVEENVQGQVSQEDVLGKPVQSAENAEQSNQASTEQSTLAVTESSEQTEDVSSLSQMREDADNILKNYELILPLKGEITSEFGLREIEPKFHTGIDIGALTGTEIVSALEGEVILASSEGQYGKHLKIQNGDIVTLYAHCSKLYVEEGDKIEKGQKIAEVGETGNATGPHLHFEIIYNGRYVDPSYVIEF